MLAIQYSHVLHDSEALDIVRILKIVYNQNIPLRLS
jgi:hypothetical protein